MFYGACRQDNPTEHKFCGGCGEPLRSAPPPTPQTNPVNIDKLDLNVFATVKRDAMAKCKSCEKEVAKTAPTCPHCGEALPGSRITCPTCGSRSIVVAGQRGFSLSAAAGGFFLAGAAGLLTGMVGRKRIQLQCQRCGTRWEPSGVLGQ